jgi:hypothetical protein
MKNRVNSKLLEIQYMKVHLAITLKDLRVIKLKEMLLQIKDNKRKHINLF